MIEDRFIEIGDPFVVRVNEKLHIGIVESIAQDEVVLVGRSHDGSFRGTFKSTPNDLMPMKLDEPVFKSLWHGSYEIILDNVHVQYSHPYLNAYTFVAKDGNGNKTVGGSRLCGWHDFLNFLREAKLETYAKLYSDLFAKYYSVKDLSISREDFKFIDNGRSSDTLIATPLIYNIGKGARAFSTRTRSSIPVFVRNNESIFRLGHPGNNKIAIVKSLDDIDLGDADAAITNVANIPISACTADAVPILLYDTETNAVGVIHCGWRETVSKLPLATIRAMAENYGTNAKDIIAVIGPSIGPYSFRVDRDVFNAFDSAGFPMDIISFYDGEIKEESMEGGLHIDLWEANRHLLNLAGVTNRRIDCTRIDTYRHLEFNSVRRDGDSCRRFDNCIMIY